MHQAASQELHATIRPTGPESAVVLFADGTIERLGPPATNESLACLIGGEIAPIAVCEDRALVQGRLGRLFAGDGRVLEP
jgi:hypothetical protein